MLNSKRSGKSSATFIPRQVWAMLSSRGGDVLSLNIVATTAGVWGID